MLTYRQVDWTYARQFDDVPMSVLVTSEYRVEKTDRGLGGFTLREVPVEPYVKDFRLDIDESMVRWEEQFDVSNWGFFMVFEGESPVAAASVAARTENVDMLAGRSDLAVLWDIRVADSHKQQGIGQKLFDMVVDWSRSQSYKQLKIECQNNNVPAVKFYHKQGAILCGIDEFAYYNHPEYKHEVQLLWYLDL